MALYYPLLEEEANLEPCPDSQWCLCSDNYVVDDRYFLFFQSFCQPFSCKSLLFQHVSS